MVAIDDVTAARTGVGAVVIRLSRLAGRGFDSPRRRRRARATRQYEGVVVAFYYFSPRRRLKDLPLSLPLSSGVTGRR